MIVFRQTPDETKKTYCPISLGAISYLWIPSFCVISAFPQPCYDNGIYLLAIRLK